MNSSLLRPKTSPVRPLPALSPRREKLEWHGVLPFLFLHLGCLGVFCCGWSPVAIVLAVGLYWVRMFAITAFYHRYFSHRTFKTGRFWQFVFALWAMFSVQRGPLWWASHHRKHHRVTEQPEDPHSPVVKGMFWSHFGWLTTAENLKTDYDAVKDLARFPELVWLNRYDGLVSAFFALLLYGAGWLCSALFPQWHTSGFQFLIWGFFVSTVVLFHGTCTINSLAHCFGSQRYHTGDQSRNNFWLALITLGEGWHNNHHRYPFTTRQGLFWWEIDVTYYILKSMAALGIIHHMNSVPAQAYQPQPPVTLKPLSPVSGQAAL